MGIDSNYSPDMLEDLLPLYYKKAFPHNLFVRWLSYSRPSKSYFAYREFTFTLKDDVYVRFQSFNDQAEFEKELLRILPHKMDIGAVYTHRPREHKTINSMAFQATERELIFDIDMTDYDDVRYCTSVTSPPPLLLLLFLLILLLFLFPLTRSDSAVLGRTFAPNVGL